MIQKKAVRESGNFLLFDSFSFGKKCSWKHEKCRRCTRASQLIGERVRHSPETRLIGAAKENTPVPRDKNGSSDIK
ncbi:MAG: hypothetical protein ACLSEX_05325 [Blautia sp.]